MVLALPDGPARGQKPVSRDELGAVVTIHRNPLNGYLAAVPARVAKAVHGAGFSLAPCFADGS
ncbi:MAG: hypothetical protein JXA30_12540 [Deltaproteobacteria bacterium]|nr:hypothetical protein [Deltaproteobacteria bacterium]